MRKKEVKVEEPVHVVEETVVEKPKIAPLTQEFGNGEMNVLRDKINEIINR